MKRIEIRLLAAYRKYLPEMDRGTGSTLLEVDDGLNLGGLLEQSGIEAGRPLVVLVNGRYASYDKIVMDGDVVSVFPPVGGG